MLLLMLSGPAAAATLYRWTDASGTVRYGHQPPPGVEVVPAEEEARELSEAVPPVACRDLAEQHLRLVDQEIARVKNLPAGLGPEYEFSPAVKQELILDLYAHRAALLTGRDAAEFRSPGSGDIARLKSRYDLEKRQLESALKAREETIEAQRRRLEEEHRLVNHFRNLIHPHPPTVVIPPAGP
jgi:hypothetical protein